MPRNTQDINITTVPDFLAVYDRVASLRIDTPNSDTGASSTLILPGKRYFVFGWRQHGGFDPNDTAWGMSVLEVGNRKAGVSSRYPEKAALGSWYYSSKHLTEIRAGGPISNIGKSEMVPSDHLGLFPLACFRGVVRIHFISETAISMPLMGPTDFYLRIGVQLKGFGVDPQLSGTSKICRSSCRARNSYDADNASVTLRWCFRCSKWYHASCLQQPQRRLITREHPQNYLRSAVSDNDILMRIITKPIARVNRQDVITSLELLQHYALRNLVFAEPPRSTLKSIVEKCYVFGNGCNVPENWESRLTNAAHHLGTLEWRECPRCTSPQIYV